MIQVALLNTEQAEQLINTEFVTDNYFNPTIDKNGNYFISLEEVEQCDIEWVKLLPLIAYEPVTINL